MRRSARFAKHSSKLPLNLIGLLVVAVTFVAHAQPIATGLSGSGGEVTGGAKQADRPAWRGTSVNYSHNLGVMTLAPAAEPFYNPTWSQRLGLFPEWHFGDLITLRGRFFLSQEFTESDSTRYRNEVELSDVWLDTVWSGFTEKNSRIHLGADLRVTLPTSKVSQAQTRILTLGPSLNVSRRFDVLSGLTLIYTGRFTWRANRFATRQNEGPKSCGDTRALECADFILNSGVRNVQFDLLHGPVVSFAPHPKVDVSASFLMQRGWLPALAAAPAELAGSTELAAGTGVATRDLMIFSLSVSYQAFKAVGFSLGAWTFSNQLGEDGRYQFPLFNRNTTLYLDATFDLEGAVSSFRKEKS
jgi:hypothetical protein